MVPLYCKNTVLMEPGIVCICQSPISYLPTSVAYLNWACIHISSVQVHRNFPFSFSYDLKLVQILKLTCFLCGKFIFAFFSVCFSQSLIQCTLRLILQSSLSLCSHQASFCFRFPASSEETLMEC